MSDRDKLIVCIIMFGLFVCSAIYDSRHASRLDALEALHPEVSEQE